MQIAEIRLGHLKSLSYNQSPTPVTTSTHSSHPAYFPTTSFPVGRLLFIGEHRFKVHPILEHVDYLSHRPEGSWTLLLSLQTVEQVANTITEVAVETTVHHMSGSSQFTLLQKQAASSEWAEQHRQQQQQQVVDLRKQQTTAICQAQLCYES